MSVLCERHFQLRTAQAGPTMPPKPQCLDCLRAENEKLREALALLWDEATDGGRCHPPTPFEPRRYHFLSIPCKELVRAALALTLPLDRKVES